MSEWRFGEGSFIVSDEPTGCDDPDNVRAYGGHLVCESVSQVHRNLILAAPDMLAALEAVAEIMPGSLDSIGGGTLIAPTIKIQVIKDAKAAIAKAKGGWKHANPISVIVDGLKIRLKPWELGRTVNGHTLPDGAEWHRQDFTEDMLPAPWRPLMLGERARDGDEFAACDWKFSTQPYDDYNTAEHFEGLWHRTTRPIPFTLTPKKIADGWVLWSGGECPVEAESQPTVMLQDGTILPVRSSASRMDWKPGAKPDGDDIIAYKPDPYGKFRQALADGETVQLLDSGRWFDFDPLGPCFSEPVECYRIKPEPQWLPLGPEDVPPLSMIRRKGQTDEYGKPQYWHWRFISYVTGIGPVCADRGYNWQELSTDYEINRPRHRDADGNPTLWEECRKEAK